MRAREGSAVTHLPRRLLLADQSTGYLSMRPVLGSIREILNPTSGSKRDLVERIYIPRNPPNPTTPIQQRLPLSRQS